MCHIVSMNDILAPPKVPAHRTKAARKSLADLVAGVFRNAEKGEPTVLSVIAMQASLSPRFAAEEIDALVIPKRTLARRKAINAPLSLEETDKAIRLARIAAEADRVFGNPDKAARWLRTPHGNISGQTPLYMLKTEAGAILVGEMLTQIDHGMFA
jgi:putative toxin-antitoxin system antitoxin component (TIGR02293 family)